MLHYLKSIPCSDWQRHESTSEAGGLYVACATLEVTEYTITVCGHVIRDPKDLDCENNGHAWQLKTRSEGDAGAVEPIRVHQGIGCGAETRSKRKS